jgi:hypothetical protein
LNVVVAEEQTARSREANGVLRAFRTPCTLIRLRPTGTPVADWGSNLLLSLPSTDSFRRKPLL